jgi:hypothetical protein
VRSRRSGGSGAGCKADRDKSLMSRMCVKKEALKAINGCLALTLAASVNTSAERSGSVGAILENAIINYLIGCMLFTDS